jgi:signal peptidase I
MKKKIEKYNALKTTYGQRRSFFKQKLETFTSRSSRKMQQYGLHLIAQADQLLSEMATLLQGHAPEQALPKEFHKKFRLFKKAYKQLNEMTKPLWRQWAETIGFALILVLILRNLIFGLFHVPTGSAEPNILVGDRLWGNKMCYFYEPIKRGDLVIFDSPLVEYDHSSSMAYMWQRYIGFPIPLFGLPAGPDNWVKRVIAVPGDTIEGRMENGKTVIYRNGKKLDEPYVNNLPLIGLRKTRGFLPWETIGIFTIPSFLQYREIAVSYTYDPSKSFADQPYYTMTADEVLRYPDGRPEFRLPFTPCIEYGVNRDTFGPFTIPAGKYWVMGDSRKNSIDSRWWLFLDIERIHGRASFVIYSVDSEEAIWLFDLLKHPIDFFTKHIRWNRFFKSLNGFTFTSEEEHTN